jgi:MFS family permease
MFILLRGAAGALTAGLIPAATGIVADLAPHDRRAQWIGVMNGGASIGWIAGPILGGVLFDRWGYEVALLVSIGMAPHPGGNVTCRKVVACGRPLLCPATARPGD